MHISIKRSYYMCKMLCLFIIHTHTHTHTFYIDDHYHYLHGCELSNEIMAEQLRYFRCTAWYHWLWVLGGIGLQTVSIFLL